jgi:hypothetical protein
MLHKLRNTSISLLKTVVFFPCIFIVQISIGQIDPCISQTTLVCGTNSNYTLPSGSGSWNPPGPWGTPGNEQVYSYTPAITGSYDIQVTNDNYYVDLFISNNCGPAGWTYLNDVLTNEISTVNLTVGVTYYFLIDDENTTASSGFISISCPCIPPIGGIDQSLVISSPVTNYVSTTIGSCNDCNYRASNDLVLEVEIICDANYVFSFCGQANWDTYLYLSDLPCGGTVLSSNDDDCGLQSTISINLNIGTYYITIEGYSPSSAGAFDLSINTTCNFAPLPIELLYFVGENDNRKNILDWRTITELNNDYFIIERSENGVDFTQLGIIDGHGTTTTPQDYSFVDDNYIGNFNYYRLKQVDIEGDVEEFNLVAISSDYNGDLMIYPNPAKNILTISSEDKLINPSLTLQNALGKNVLIETYPSGNQLILEFDEMPGIYLLTIASMDRIIKRKLIIH